MSKTSDAMEIEWLPPLSRFHRVRRIRHHPYAQAQLRYPMISCGRQEESGATLGNLVSSEVVVTTIPGELLKRDSILSSDAYRRVRQHDAVRRQHTQFPYSSSLALNHKDALASESI